MRILPPGCYALTREIENPRPYKRNRHDWRAAPGFDAGTKYRVVDAVRALREALDAHDVVAAGGVASPLEGT